MGEIRVCEAWRGRISPSRHLTGGAATPEGVWFKPHERNSNPYQETMQLAKTHIPAIGKPIGKMSKYDEE